MVIGHQLILDFLKKSVQHQRLAHAYLFVGPEHVGKKTIALEFIKFLTGQDPVQGFSPDVMIVEPIIEDKKGIKKELEINIDQARQIKKQLGLSPYQASYKVALIDQAEKMTRQAANALLKTLEEPQGQSILILISSFPGSLLTTITSRCQMVNFLPVPAKEIKRKLPSATDEVVRLACGCPGLVIQYLEEPNLLKKQQQYIVDLNKLLTADLNQRYLWVEKIVTDLSLARAVLNTWLLWFRDLMLIKAGCAPLAIFSKQPSLKIDFSLEQLKGLILSVKKTDTILKNTSLNPRLALEVLMLDFEL